MTHNAQAPDAQPPTSPGDAAASPPPGEQPHPAQQPDGPGSHAPDQRQVGDLYLDAAQQRAWRAGQDLGLTRTEFAVLWTLAGAPNQPYSRYLLSQQVWGSPDTGNTNLVAVCIRRLRRKLEPDPAHPRYILTTRGSGYVLRNEE